MQEKEAHSYSKEFPQEIIKTKIEESRTSEKDPKINKIEISKNDKNEEQILQKDFSTMNIANRYFFNDNLHVNEYPNECFDYYHHNFYQPVMPFYNTMLDTKKFKPKPQNIERQFFDPIIFTTDDYELERKYHKKEKCVSSKPPFSYSQLITKAIEESKGGILTLSEIYKWIQDNYEYYRKSDTTWQNSIRHNLSLNKSFKKVARPSNKPGKGGYWAIDYDFLANGSKKKKKTENNMSLIFEECYRKSFEDNQIFVKPIDNCKRKRLNEDTESSSEESAVNDEQEVDFYDEYLRKRRE